MDGLLIVDKPAGPTSHDVVARVRRSLGERRIGHTGTLDPAATGVLPLVLGRATRLARFLSASDKSYVAVIRLGVSTDTCDAEGHAIGVPFDGALPSRDDVERALSTFRGTFDQQPPAYSAKKIAGTPSYAIARRGKRRVSAGGGAQPEEPFRPPLPQPVRVTTYALDLVKQDEADLTLNVTCSAGFYVRSLAHDLGQQLGTGAHLVGLRRVRSGELTLDAAVPLDVIEREPVKATAALIPMAGMLPALSAVTLTFDGVRHTIEGRDLGVGDLAGRVVPAPWLRLLHPDGRLVALATPARLPGLLHPSVVLV